MLKPTDFETEWIGELAALLIEAFAESEARRLAGDGGGSGEDLAVKGRFAMGQFAKARKLLKKIGEWAQEPAALKVANGTDKTQARKP